MTFEAESFAVLVTSEVLKTNKEGERRTQAAIAAAANVNDITLSLSPPFIDLIMIATHPSATPLAASLIAFLKSLMSSAPPSTPFSDCSGDFGLGIDVGEGEEEDEEEVTPKVVIVFLMPAPALPATFAIALEASRAYW
jgi:hypothetical protein